MSPDTPQLTLPPIIGTLTPLHNFNPISLFEAQFSLFCCSEVEERGCNAALRAHATFRWRWRRGLFLSSKAGNARGRRGGGNTLEAGLWACGAFHCICKSSRRVGVSEVV